eukprot:scaffold1190_cov69-Cylindrotheca_fusiformis.AAC.7
MIAIVERMLLIRDDKNWEMEGSKKDSWMSILGTRVQMGQTSIDISSSIVAGGYANLVNVTKDTAQISFPPDPVCARLAMRLMDPDWNHDRTARGMDKSKDPSETKATGMDQDWDPSKTKAAGMPKDWWVKKAKILFSEGLCVPEKGDCGEVMVALYFLFCADEERKAMKDDYRTFSVRLDSWLDRLEHGGHHSPAWVNFSERREEHKNVPMFGAIQVCRNYLRAFDTGWKELGNGSFLETMYKSGVGFYVFPGCKTIDLVFPLKMADAKFAPLVVSVKSRAYFSPKDVELELARMEAKAVEAK